MGRAIAGAVVGYVVLFLIIFAGLTLAWMLMGADGAFKTGTWNTSTAWVVTMLLVGLVAAVAGGCVAAKVGKQSRAVLILAGIVLVLGLADVAMKLGADGNVLDSVRLGDTPMLEAMGKARPPSWFPIVNMIVGACGVLVGGRLQGGSSR